MSDTPTVGLSGEWVGSYVNEEDFREDGGHEFGISSRIVQEGGKLSGTMVDLHPVNAVPLHLWQTIPSAARWSSVDRAGFETFLRRYPDAVVQTAMPERSRIVGEIENGRVRFDKRYFGLGWVVTYSRGKELSKALTGEDRVDYSGLLSEDGQEIAGLWTVWRRGRPDQALAQGTFRLTRCGASDEIALG